MDKTSRTGNASTDTYAQLFVYRVPKRNHDAMAELQEKIHKKWKTHGILSTEFFQMTQHETVRGFTNIGETIAAGPDVEVWAEIQHYRDRDHRDEIFTAIRKDTDMLELFGQFYGLVVPGVNSVMGDFNRLDL